MISYPYRGEEGASYIQMVAQYFLKEITIIYLITDIKHVTDQY